MRYSVVVTPQALEELDAAFAWLVARSPQHAPLWYNRILDAITSLEEHATRCPYAPESRAAGEDVRHLIIGDRIHAYRIVFAIRGSVVVVLDVMHGARVGEALRQQMERDEEDNGT